MKADSMIEKTFILNRHVSPFDYPKGSQVHKLATVGQYTSYLIIDPAQIRIRKTIYTSDDVQFVKHELTIDGLCHPCIEKELTKEEYNRIISINDLRPIVKVVDTYGVDDNIIQVQSVDPGSVHGFVIAKVVFASESDAESFVWPFTSGIIETMTNSKESMVDYWKRTRLNIN